MSNKYSPFKTTRQALDQKGHLLKFVFFSYYILIDLFFLNL
jgi:hypothetical protein